MEKSLLSPLPISPSRGRKKEFRGKGFFMARWIEDLSVSQPFESRP